MDVQPLVSDAVIWATYLLIVIGVVTVVSVAVVALMARPGGRWSPGEARALYRRIVTIAVVVFVAAFFGGLIVGAFQ